MTTVLAPLSIYVTHGRHRRELFQLGRKIKKAKKSLARNRYVLHDGYVSKVCHFLQLTEEAHVEREIELLEQKHKAILEHFKAEALEIRFFK